MIIDEKSMKINKNPVVTQATPLPPFRHDDDWRRKYDMWLFPYDENQQSSLLLFTILYNSMAGCYRLKNA